MSADIRLPTSVPGMLNTERLRLLPPLHIRDAASTHRHITDAITSLWIGWDTPRSLAETEAALANAFRRRSEGDYQAWAAYLLPEYRSENDKDRSIFVGEVTLERVPASMRGAWYELDFWVAEEHWGQGFAFEMAQAAINWAVCFTELPCVTLSWTHGNERSRRVIERLIPGQAPEVHPAFKNGVELPVYHYVRQLRGEREVHRQRWAQTEQLVVADN